MLAIAPVYRPFIDNHILISDELLIILPDAIIGGFLLIFCVFITVFIISILPTPN